MGPVDCQPEIEVLTSDFFKSDFLGKSHPWVEGRVIVAGSAAGMLTAVVT
jgi:hypothetical protein